MTNRFYKEAFDSALKELASLNTRRKAMMKVVNEIEDRMDKVRQGALGLITLADIDFQEIKAKYPDLFEEQIDTRIGITDAIREVLRNTSETLTPIEIRDRVFQISPAIAGQKNPLASIHTVLRRLEDNDEVVKAVFDPDGTTVYGWVGSDDWEERVRGWFADDEKEQVIERLRQSREKSKKK